MHKKYAINTLDDLKCSGPSTYFVEFKPVHIAL